MPSSELVNWSASRGNGLAFSIMSIAVAVSLPIAPDCVAVIGDGGNHGCEEISVKKYIVRLRVSNASSWKR